MKKIILIIIGFIILININSPFLKMAYELRVGGRLFTVFSEVHSIDIDDLEVRIENEFNLESKNVNLVRVGERTIEIEITKLSANLSSSLNSFVENKYDQKLELVYTTYLEKVKLSLASITKVISLTLLYIIGYCLMLSAFFVRKTKKTKVERGKR